MNTCILMAEIVKDPELRYTQQDQLAIAEILVQFPGSRPEDPSGTLKAVGFGTMATEIQETYRAGDRVVLEGRLTINTIDRPEGFKEKRAELRVSRMHKLSSLINDPLAAPPSAAPPPAAARTSAPPRPAPAAAVPQPAPAPPPEDIDYDDIPF